MGEKSYKAVRFMCGFHRKELVWGFKAWVPHMQQNDAAVSLCSDGQGYL